MPKEQKQPVRHHYVPAFLLSNFTTENGCLWVYDSVAKECWPGCPESAGYEKHWHTVARKDGVKDSTSIETIVTERYDTPGSIAVRKLLNREHLDSVNRDSFFRFVASLMMRTPRSIRQMTEVGTAVLSESARRLAAHDPGFQSRVTERLKQAGASDVEINSVLTDMAEGRTSVIPRHEFTLITNLMEVELLAQNLTALNWMFCFLPDSQEDFIIGDHPVLLEDVCPGTERGYLGIANPNIELILPLGKRMAAVANHTCQPSYGVFQAGMASMINQRTLCWSERFVYADHQSDNLLQAAVDHRGKGPALHVEHVTNGKSTGIMFVHK